MFVEQIQDSNEFVSSALALQKDYNEKVSSYLLQCIVRHGLITRNDTRENTDRLESKFFPKAKKPLLIERAKDKYSKSSNVQVLPLLVVIHWVNDLFPSELNAYHLATLTLLHYKYTLLVVILFI